MQQTELHSTLKEYYLGQGASEEVLVDGYWIDIVQGELLIEIQTRNFTALRKKVADLLQRHPVRIVHPVPIEKWIVRLPPDDKTVKTRRKSPRRGRLEDLFNELVRIPDLLSHPNFSLEILMIREEEIRKADGKGSWRRNGVSILDRRLLEIVEKHLFLSPPDLRKLLPEDLEEPFTNRELARKLAISPRLAGRMTYCLRSMQILQIVGKDSKSNLYRRIE